MSKDDLADIVKQTKRSFKDSTRKTLLTLVAWTSNILKFLCHRKVRETIRISFTIAGTIVMSYSIVESKMIRLGDSYPGVIVQSRFYWGMFLIAASYIIELAQIWFSSTLKSLKEKALLQLSDWQRLLSQQRH